MKSPLRYPGGKTRAVKIISTYFPNVDTLISPFFGGGSIEIAHAARGIRVKGFDLFAPLVCFWNYLQSDPQELFNEVKKLHPMDKNDFVTLQKKNPEMEDGVEKAAVFYALNRCSFSGSTMSGGMSNDHPRFNDSNMQTILKFSAPTLTVENKDYRESIITHPNEFMYLDPPYLLEEQSNKLYGVQGSTHKGFDHDDLFECLKDRPNWIMSYNSGPAILARYSDFKMIVPNWAYGMSKDKESKEVLIFSKDLSPTPNLF